MSKKQQTEKNLKLSVKLVNFIADNPRLSQSMISGASVVPFSLSDQALNQSNEKLIEELLEEGKTVVKAEETKDSKNPWKFTSVSL